MADTGELDMARNIASMRKTLKGDSSAGLGELDMARNLRDIANLLKSGAGGGGGSGGGSGGAPWSGVSWGEGGDVNFTGAGTPSDPATGRVPALSQMKSDIAANKSAAQSAQSAAQSAQSAAQSAQGVASQAQSAAQSAQSLAAGAKSTAADAKTAADSASSAAADAKTAAADAKTAAQSASDGVKGKLNNDLTRGDGSLFSFPDGKILGVQGGKIVAVDKPSGGTGGIGSVNVDSTLKGNGVSAPVGLNPDMPYPDYKSDFSNKPALAAVRGIGANVPKFAGALPLGLGFILKPDESSGARLELNVDSASDNLLKQGNLGELHVMPADLSAAGFAKKSDIPSVPSGGGRGVFSAFAIPSGSSIYSLQFTCGGALFFNMQMFLNKLVPYTVNLTVFSSDTVRTIGAIRIYDRTGVRVFSASEKLSGFVPDVPASAYNNVGGLSVKAYIQVADGAKLADAGDLTLSYMMNNGKAFVMGEYSGSQSVGSFSAQ